MADMARLDILVHEGCLSEHTVRSVAHDIGLEFPDWQIEIRVPEKRDKDVLGVLVYPAFILDGSVLVTGMPEKDWLLSRLREREKLKR